MSTSLKYKIDLDFVGLGNAGDAYGGFLHAWAFQDKQGPQWFSEFREFAINSIGKEFLPIYRMADGEYRFLFGRRINWHRKQLHRELLAVGAEKLRIKNPDRWETSWGEKYAPEQTKALRAKLIEQIRSISEVGLLACYITENGLNAFTEYNDILLQLFRNNNIHITADNYIPFHFAPSLFVGNGWQDVLGDRHVLIVTGLNDEKEAAIERTMRRMGVKKTSFLPISPTASLAETIDPARLDDTVDIALVAAGIGSANILTQLAPLNTLCVDIGGLMNSFVDNSARQHGGVIGLPETL